MSKSRGRVRIGAIGILVALALAIYAIVARTPSQASGPSTWGDILIAGGVLSDDSETTTTELFDETTDTFAATTPQMAVARSGQVQNLIIAG
ncbi:MAG TPA: hypothetical protein VMU16_03010, partial [Candidatus Binataceae bacterium]|nr:hypothetical protein [Candidatus Binataceae bacterium]